MKINIVLKNFLICIISIQIGFAQSTIYQHTKGPYGGGAYNVYNQDGICYVTTSNGLYKSADNGENWIRIEDNLPQFYEALGFCFEANEQFLSYSPIASQSYGLVYSEDGGVHWAEIKTPMSEHHIFEMAYSKGVLIIIQDRKLFESKDKGQSWSELTLPSNNFYPGLVRANDQFFYLASYDHIYRRPISGVEWTLIYQAGDFYDFHLTNQTCIVLRDRKNGYTSLDNGENWSANNISAYNSDYNIADFGDSLFYLMDEVIMISKDRGVHWHSHINLGDHNFTEVIQVGNKIVLNKLTEGLFYSDDQFKTYKGLNYGIYSQKALNLAQNSEYLFSPSWNSVSRFSKKVNLWEKDYVYLGSDNLGHVICLDSTVIIPFSYGYECKFSSDNGNTFYTSTIGNHFFHFSFDHLASLKIGNKIILNNGISIITNDQGKSWNEYKPQYNGKDNYILDLSKFEGKGLALVRDPGSTLYKIISSTDLDSWTLFSDLSFISNNNPSLLRLITDGNHLFLISDGLYSSTLYKYSKLNQEWKPVHKLPVSLGSIPEEPKTLVKLPDGHFMLNLSNGLWISEDEGEHWYLYLDEFYTDYSNIKTDLALLDDRLFISNYYFGVIERGANIEGLKQKGQVFFDKNKNNTFDSDDKALRGTYLFLDKSKKHISTNEDGKYQIFMTSNRPDTLVTTHQFKHGQFVPNKRPLSLTGQDLAFAFQMDDDIDDVSISAYESPLARPGFKYFLTLMVTNHSAKPWSGKVSLSYDPIFNFISVDFPYQSKITNTLEWQLDSLLPLDQQLIRVELFLDRNITVGTQIEHKGWAKNDFISDYDDSDNSFNITSKVVASCDPNDIQVDRHQITPEELDNKTELEYKIRFQNTGNYLAEFVDISVPINLFHLETMKITGSSHPYQYATEEHDGKLVFHFDMINLPDSSSDEKNSHGFISFKIAANKNRVSNNQIENYASIVFDYNEPLATNKAITIIKQNQTNTKELTNEENLIHVHPNPFSGKCTLSWNFSEEEISDVSVYSIDGKKIPHLFHLSNNSEAILELGVALPGLYFVELRFGKNNALTKSLFIVD